MVGPTIGPTVTHSENPEYYYGFARALLGDPQREHRKKLKTIYPELRHAKMFLCERGFNLLMS